MRLTIIYITIFLANSISGQNTVDSVLAHVERNNLTLAAYRKNIDAEKIGNKTGLYPQNPEAEFSYLWGSPSAIGNRTDFSIKQSFDFPTAYSYKNQISGLKNEQAELEYRKQRYEVLFQAQQICVKLIYHNALKSELNKRLSNIQQLAHAYKAKFNSGETGILDYNKAQINLLNIGKDIEKNEIERNVLLNQLAAYNGGISIDLNDSVFSVQTIPSDFNQWYIQVESFNPFLQWLKYETEISGKQAKLNTALSLPEFYAGYMSEKVAGEQLQGITIGISIPLWENRNSGKYAKAKSIAIQNMEADAKLNFYNDMKSAHAKAIALQNSVIDYRTKLSEFNNQELLNKAFNLGEISLSEYLYELSFYYESISRLIEMEMNFNMALSDLRKFY